MRRRFIALLLGLGLVGAACSGADSDTGADAAAPAATGSDEAAGDTGDGDSGADTPADEATGDATTELAGDTEEVPVDWPHDFAGETLDGGQIDANDLAGRDLVLWFWAPW